MTAATVNRYFPLNVISVFHFSNIWYTNMWWYLYDLFMSDLTFHIVSPIVPVSVSIVLI